MDAQHSVLLRQYHELRKQVFVDALKWDLPHHDGMEWDQYDSPQSVNILIEEDGHCVGGCRLMRCDMTHKIGEIEYSYMLRDAHRGLLQGIPRDVITEPPTGPAEWEMTRGICGRNPRQFRDMFRAASDYIMSQGGQYCTFLSRPVSLRFGAMWGFEIKSMGPVTQIGNGDWLAVRYKMK